MRSPRSKTTCLSPTTPNTERPLSVMISGRMERGLAMTGSVPKLSVLGLGTMGTAMSDSDPRSGIPLGRRATREADIHDLAAFSCRQLTLRIGPSLGLSRKALLMNPRFGLFTCSP